jgi:hypothetical protein
VRGAYRAPQRRVPVSGLLELGDAAYAAAVDRWLDEPGDGTRQAVDAEAARAAVRQAEQHRPAHRSARRRGVRAWRVVVDNLVVFRETRSFPIAELDWVSARSDPEHFVAARRWLRERGLPEIVFASIGSETKPVFVDFRSEVQVSNLAQLLRAGAATEDASVTFSEMLPAPSSHGWPTPPETSTPLRCAWCSWMSVLMGRLRRTLSCPRQRRVRRGWQDRRPRFPRFFRRRRRPTCPGAWACRWSCGRSIAGERRG